MESIKSRNQLIKEALENNNLPVLPFEIEVAQRAMKIHIEKQAELGKRMGEAMQQSSETWHDNAPAEAIANDSKTLASSAEKTMEIINNSEIFEYVSEAETATLGSLVGVTYGDDSEVVFLYLTGVIRELPSNMHDESHYSDIETVTISSPVGAAIFDKEVGDEVSVQLGNGRQIKITIVSIGASA